MSHICGLGRERERKKKTHTHTGTGYTLLRALITNDGYSKDEIKR
jgi:hypothetical protein